MTLVQSERARSESKPPFLWLSGMARWWSEAGYSAHFSPWVWLDVRSCLLSGDRCILEAHTHATFSGSAGYWSCLPLMLWTLTSWSEYEYHTQLQNCACNCSFFLCKEYTFGGPETTIRRCKHPISHQTQILRTHLFRSAWIHEFLFHSVLIMTLIFRSP